MLKQIQKATVVLAFVPFLTMPSTMFALNIGSFGSSFITNEEVSVDNVRKSHAEAIDTYFKERNMPLEGTGMTFVLVAEKYGLDWNLLPAIAVRESSGGKNACGYNAFGWASPKNCNHAYLKSYEEAIEIVGKNLGGANERTAKYYAGKSTEEKLYYYNGTVVSTYPNEVIAIMNKIESNIN